MNDIRPQPGTPHPIPLYSYKDCLRYSGIVLSTIILILSCQGKPETQELQKPHQNKSILYQFIVDLPFAETETNLRKIAFDDPSQLQFLSSGWNDFTQSDPDEPGCKIVGEKVSIDIPRVVPEPLAVRLKLFAPEEGKIQIHWNNHFVETISLKSGDQEIQIDIPEEYQYYGPNRMEILPESSQSISQLKSRLNSIRFFEIEFIPQNRTGIHIPAKAMEIHNHAILQYPETVLTFYPQIPGKAVLRGEVVLGETIMFPGETTKTVISLVDSLGKEHILRSFEMKDITGNSKLSLREDLSPFEGEFVAISLSFQIINPNSLRDNNVHRIHIRWNYLRIEGSLLDVPIAASPISRDRYNILLVLFDAMRSDHTEPYGSLEMSTPQMKRLASEGTTFLNTSAQSSWTRTSVTSFLTSTYPWIHGTLDREDTLSGTIPYLPEILQQEGYQTTALINNIVIAPHTYGFDRGFDKVYEIYNTPGYDQQAEDRSDLVWEKLLKPCLDRQNDKPFFIYLHEFDPHDPYTPPPPFDRMYYPDYSGKIDGSTRVLNLINKNRITISPDDLRYIHSLYQGEISSMDRFLGKILDYLETNRLDENTLVVLMSDHGEEFKEHDRMRHALSLYEEVLQVPLIFSLKGVIPEGRKLRFPVQLIDLAPTLLDLIGAPIPSTMQGKSLLPEMTLPENYAPLRFTYATLGIGPHDILSARYGSWKLIGRKFEQHFRRWHLYNLDEDPKEQSDCWPQNPVVGKGMLRILQQKIEQDSRIKPDAPLEIQDDQIDVKMLQELKAMGYMD